MGEGIYHREQLGDVVRIDPDSLNLDALPITLAVVGWTVNVNYPETEGGEISISLSDSGGADGKSDVEVAESLGIIDNETAELLPGYSVTDRDGQVRVGYQGIPDVRFAEFVKGLHELSPFGA